MQFFLFGSLMDPDVAEVVLGRRLQRCEMGAATLHGYQRLVVAAETYPALAPCPRARVSGVLLHHVSGEELARMQFFESEEFSPQPCEVILPGGARVQATVFLATAALEYGRQEWSYSRWLRRDKAQYLDQARQWMAAYGRQQTHELEPAWSQARGEAGPAGRQPAISGEEQT